MVVYVIDFSQASKNGLNPLSGPVRDYLWQQLEMAKASPQVTSVVITGGLTNFSAGADISEFDGPPPSGADRDVNLIDIVTCIEQFQKPVVAAISGNALGGGLEVALSCHYRVCTTNATMGLPEVMVGVVPGAGGTQRLPRLIGLEKALHHILTAIPMKGKRAAQLGLVDATVETPQQLIDTAQKWAEWAELMPLEDRRVSSKIVPDAKHAARIAKQAAKMLPHPSQGGFVQHCALKAVLASATQPFEQGQQIESQQFRSALTSNQGKARRHAFFAIRKAQKPVAALQPTTTSHPLLQRQNNSVQVAVIGAGTMGGGIALVLLQAGFSVTLVDIAKSALEKGVKQIHKIVQGYVAKRKLAPTKAKKLLARLSSTTRMEDLTSVQLVVEAVVERMKIKKSIFQTLDQVTPPSCILLSNTSTLDIDEMAFAVSAARRQTFAGWHFFSPAHVMKLVEIVKGKETSTATVVLLQALTKRIKKLGVVVGNCYGFCGNRLLRPYGREAAMILPGARTPQVVDSALTKFGMAMGVFTMGDLAGNDIEYNIRRELGWVRDPDTNAVGPNRPPRYTELGDDLVSKLGRIGQKAGKGWYDYNPKVGKGRKPLPSKEVEAFIQSFATASFTTGQAPLSEAAIIKRVMFPLVNEGFKCLEEGIAQSPSDIDVVYINGYGWPIWRGGPMFWADNEVGLPALLATLRDFASQFPEEEHFVPSKLLKNCVQMDVTVDEYYAKGLQHQRQSRL